MSLWMGEGMVVDGGQRRDDGERNSCSRRRQPWRVPSGISELANRRTNNGQLTPLVRVPLRNVHLFTFVAGDMFEVLEEMLKARGGEKERKRS